MAINGIAANYFSTGYTNNQATKAETGKTFAEIASQKVEEAEKETGVHITPDGEHSYMTAAGVQIAIKWSKGELNQTDLLGSSVESAINAVNKWIYDLEHPLAGQPARSVEEQRLSMNERKFYEAFLEKLKELL